MSTFKITIRNASEAVQTILSAGLIPHLLGSPAIGKSAIIKQIADAFNLKLLDVRASGLLPEDINGMGAVVNGEAKFLPFKHRFPIEGMSLPVRRPATVDENGNKLTETDYYNGWLLFLDELTNASREVQAALYQLMLDRQLGDYNLHPQVFIVSAGNRVSDRAAANAMGTALQSRVVTLDVEPDLDEWLEDVAFPNNYDSRLISFLMANRAQFYTFSPEKREELTFSAPRTLSMLNSLLTDGGLDPASPNANAVIAGCVGSDTAAKFVLHCTSVVKLPKMEDIIRNPMGTEMPTSAALIYGVVSNCLSYIDSNTDPTEIEAITKYLMRSPSPSYLVVFGRTVIKRAPIIEALPVWLDLQTQLGRALQGLAA